MLTVFDTVCGYLIVTAALVSVPPAESLLHNVYHHRMRIERGDIVFTVATTITGKVDDVTKEYHVIFDGLRIRCDVTDPAMIAHWQDGSTTVRNELLKFVFNGNELLFHSDAISPSGGGTTARRIVVNTPHGERDMEKYRPYRIDPRHMGITPATHDAWYLFTLEGLLTDSKLHGSLEAREDTIGGRHTFRVSYRTPNGAYFQFWIDPKTYSVVHSRETFAKGDSTISDSVESELREYHSGLWFPRRVVTVRTQDGQELSRRVLTVQSAVFNEKVNPGIFTLGGLGIPAGTTVRETANASDGKVRTWDGTKLISTGAISAQSKHEVRSWLPWIIVSNVLFLSAIVSLLWWMRCRRDSV